MAKRLGTWMHVLAFDDWRYGDIYVWAYFADHECGVPELVRRWAQERMTDDGWSLEEAQEEAREVLERGNPNVWKAPFKDVEMWGKGLINGSTFNDHV